VAWMEHSRLNAEPGIANQRNDTTMRSAVGRLPENTELAIANLETVGQQTP